MEKQEKQMRLFPVPEIKSHKSPLQYAEIIEDDGSEYTLWFRKVVYSPAQAKKVAAMLYNKQRGYNPENLVKFGEVKWEINKNERR